MAAGADPRSWSSLDRNRRVRRRFRVTGERQILDWGEPGQIALQGLHYQQVRGDLAFIGGIVELLVEALRQSDRGRDTFFLVDAGSCHRPRVRGLRAPMVDTARMNARRQVGSGYPSWFV